MARYNGAGVKSRRHPARNQRQADGGQRRVPHIRVVDPADGVGGSHQELDGQG